MSELTSYHRERYDWQMLSPGHYNWRPDTYAPPDPARCAETLVWDRLTRQCSRKRGHGPEGAFCKQHALKREDTSPASRSAS